MAVEVGVLICFVNMLGVEGVCWRRIRTSSVAISCRMSMTSRAALRRASAEADSAGIFADYGSGDELMPDINTCLVANSGLERERAARVGARRDCPS